MSTTDSSRPRFRRIPGVLHWLAALVLGIVAFAGGFVASIASRSIGWLVAGAGGAALIFAVMLAWSASARRHNREARAQAHRAFLDQLQRRAPQSISSFFRDHREAQIANALAKACEGAAGWPADRISPDDSMAVISDHGAAAHAMMDAVEREFQCDWDWELFTVELYHMNLSQAVKRFSATMEYTSSRAANRSG